MKKGLLVAVLLALAVGWGGPAWAGEDPHDLYGQINFSPAAGAGVPALFGSAYRHDLSASFFDTWIWLSLISADADVHIQFYDPKCTRTNDQLIPMTENETVLLFTSEAAPDSAAGAFLVEALCDSPQCDLLGELWYLDLDDGIVFTRPLYTAGGFPFTLPGGWAGRWDIFQHEHWDWVVDGFGIFASHLWLNCPTGSGAAGTAGNTALYDDLRVGAPSAPGNPKIRSFPGFVPGPGVTGLPVGSKVDFLLINFDESPGGSRDDVPCSCLTDGPLTSISGLFADFWGLTRVKFKTATGAFALGLVHKTGGVPGLEVFDKRFHRFEIEVPPFIPGT